ncbi:MAG: hypothetical protein Hyperionvirus13_34 [Hyperionvirus sp.]|uniref:Uncharacterized protein n=1 Tax=Hyperionvirus sp. TaxID=2487770 RepID=A0A3G5AC89_9VIRU|nr:MAG: hypothetical protein Hyperionvirus13_34 [Hyperionvirus sp.]
MEVINAYLISHVDEGVTKLAVYDATEFVEMYSKGSEMKGVLIDTAAGATFLSAKKILEETHLLLRNPNYNARGAKFGGIYRKNAVQSISSMPEQKAYLIKRTNQKTQTESYVIETNQKYTNSDYVYETIDSATAESFESAKRMLVLKYPKNISDGSDANCIIL